MQGFTFGSSSADALTASSLLTFGKLFVFCARIREALFSSILFLIRDLR
jgi:hypothetical protein